jgi:hypothetical protein
MTRRLKTSCPNSPTRAVGSTVVGSTVPLQPSASKLCISSDYAKAAPRKRRAKAWLPTAKAVTPPVRTRDARSRRAASAHAPSAHRVVPPPCVHSCCVPVSCKLSRSRHLVPRHHPWSCTSDEFGSGLGDGGMSGVKTSSDKESGGSAGRQRYTQAEQLPAGRRVHGGPAGYTAGQLATRRVSGRR